MENNCGCPPVIELLEFLIPDEVINNFITNNNNRIFQIINLDLLKEDVVCQFLDILKQLECGLQPDLTDIKYNIIKINLSAIDSLSSITT